MDQDLQKALGSRVRREGEGKRAKPLDEAQVSTHCLVRHPAYVEPRCSLDSRVSKTLPPYSPLHQFTVSQHSEKS